MVRTIGVVTDGVVTEARRLAEPAAFRLCWGWAKGAFLLFTLLGATPSAAQLSAEAGVHVAVRVGTIVSVEGGGVVEAGSVQTGEVRVATQFQVSANVDTLWFQCFASDLFKAGDPSSIFSLQRGRDVYLEIPWAAPVDGGRRLLYQGPPVQGTGEAAGFLLYPTETRPWESSSLGTFTRDVTTTFNWWQTDPLAPRGTYAGYVKLLAYSLSP